MKFKFKDKGWRAVSLAGLNFSADESGAFTAPEALRSVVLAAHGSELAEISAPDGSAVAGPIAEAVELIGAPPMRFEFKNGCRALSIAGINLKANDEGVFEAPPVLRPHIEAAFRGEIREKPTLALAADDGEGEGAGAPDELADEFSTMKRGELFAYLAKHSVKVTPPVGGAELRRLCRDAAQRAA